MVEVIIFDLYGTILKADERDGVVRNGLEEFMNFYKSKKRVVFSDGDIRRIEDDLEISGLTGKFDGIYGKELMVYISRLHGGDGWVKNLEMVCKDFSVAKSDAVFIGDNFVGRDQKSAEKYGIQFIKIPQFRSRAPDWSEKDFHRDYVDYEDPKNPFSFKSLIGKL